MTSQKSPNALPPEYDQEQNSQALALLWADFVDCDERRKAEKGFLVKTLRRNNCRRVFDAALGDGCDSVHLLRNGFQVTSNEIDPDFLHVAIAAAAKQKVKLDPK